MTNYNGWKNYETWNVALWLNNDEVLYREACQYMLHPRGRGRPYKARALCRFCGAPCRRRH